ncbi:hypothetical protein N8I77_013124 [Diaporthe amygdali]|uniref:Uncharacterized protein n=1 Tax=Phomopsis amygdali TaxID=1214568 RepID=A0AAD9S3N1_PHOAM|nr:hypothetical protein N8I77_013124 [Diaporthe amygdali]
MLFTFLLGLLHLWAGVCDADVSMDDFKPVPFIYSNDYLAANSSDNKVIIVLAKKGQCMSYFGFANATLEGLASCELFCNPPQYNTWDCIAGDLQEDDWSNVFTDEHLFEWTPGTCKCWNSSDPTPSVEGDFPASPAKDLAAAEATKEVRDLSTYGYSVTTYSNNPEDMAGWNFWSIDFPNARVTSGSSCIGIFGVPKDNNDRHVMRIYEIWAGRDERDPTQKAFMHDDVIGFWRLNPLNRNLDDLKELVFNTVIEQTLNDMVTRVYRMVGADLMQPLGIFRDGQTNGEQQAFQLILTQSKFGKRMQQAIDEFEEFKNRRIEAFYFTDADEGFDFIIYFDGFALSKWQFQTRAVIPRAWQTGTLWAQSEQVEKMMTSKIRLVDT